MRKAFFKKRIFLYLNLREFLPPIKNFVLLFEILKYMKEEYSKSKERGEIKLIRKKIDKLLPRIMIFSSITLLINILLHANVSIRWNQSNAYGSYYTLQFKLLTKAWIAFHTCAGI